MNPSDNDRLTDHGLSALLLILAVLALGLALHIDWGNIDPPQFYGPKLLAIALAAATAAIAAAHVRWGDAWISRHLHWFLAGAAGFDLCMFLLAPWGFYWALTFGPDQQRIFNVLHIGVAALAIVTALSANWRRRRIFLGLFLVALAAMGVWQIRWSPIPTIDVWEVQQEAADALLHGQSPYALKVRDVYHGDPRYVPTGAAVNGHLNTGYPYLPLSLLLSMPGYMAGGDIRYSELGALVLSGLLIATARQTRAAAGAAALLLTTPKLMFILESSWIEPISVLLLAATLWCAVRRPRWTPICFGLLMASKQTMIITLPLIVLLLPRPWQWRDLLRWAWQGGVAAIVVTAPIYLMNARSFAGSALPVANLQEVHRTDALSFTTWHYLTTGIWWPDWAIIISGGAALLLGLWRAARTPAGFAAATGLTHMALFAFSKHAFANHYFFALAALCMGVGLMQLPPAALSVRQKRA